MAVVHEQYVVDEKGTRTAVILGIDEYRKMMEDIEELETIRAYDAAKASADEAIPFIASSTKSTTDSKR